MTNIKYTTYVTYNTTHTHTTYSEHPQRSNVKKVQDSKVHFIFIKFLCKKREQ